MFELPSTWRVSPDETPAYRRGMKPIIGRLLQRAKSLGMNQTELAEAMGESSQTINNWTRRELPKAKYLAAAKAVNWTVEQLVLGHDAPEASGWLFETIKQEDWAAISPTQRGIIEGEVRRMIREFNPPAEAKKRRQG